MTRSLVARLTLAFVLVALVSAAIVMVFIRFTNVDRLNHLIVSQINSSLADQLTSYYAQNGSWDQVTVVWEESGYGPGMAYPSKSPGGGMGMMPNDRRRLFALADANGSIVLPAGPEFTLGANVPAGLLKKSGTPITVDGEQVGTLLIVDHRPPLTAEENFFIERTNQALMLAAGGAVLVAMLVGIFLARTLTRPLQALTQATQRIAEGNLEQQVHVNSSDEIGQLARSFNRMSQEVARANLLRRQMTADIAHDLRTPLTVISGYIESMRDGVLQPTQARLGLIYGEIERLQRLIDDLRLLSQADAGKLPVNPQPLSPRYLLERAAAPHQHRAEQQSVALDLQTLPDLPSIQVDEARMMQVFDNLISNALRYTPAGGRVCLSAARDGAGVILSITDTGAGIPPEELALVFDRFYRVDPSRAAENGESGLGLAIVKALVEAQGGKVWAESGEQSGTRISLRFPVRSPFAAG